MVVDIYLWFMHYCRNSLKTFNNAYGNLTSQFCILLDIYSWNCAGSKDISSVHICFCICVHHISSCDEAVFKNTASVSGKKVFVRRTVHNEMGESQGFLELLNICLKGGTQKQYQETVLH